MTDGKPAKFTNPENREMILDIVDDCMDIKDQLAWKSNEKDDKNENIQKILYAKTIPVRLDTVPEEIANKATSTGSYAFGFSFKPEKED